MACDYDMQFVHSIRLMVGPLRFQLYRIIIILTKSDDIDSKQILQTET